MDTLIGAGILFVGFLAGVVVHAWAWGGRFVKRPQAQRRDDENDRLRALLAEARKDAEWNRRWMMNEDLAAAPEAYRSMPQVGTVPFDPKELRGKGDSFQR